MISDGPKAVIEALQPYDGREKNLPLRILRQLSDFDKHRRLPLIGKYANITAADVLARGWQAEEFELVYPQAETPFERKTEIFRARNLIDLSTGAEVDVDLRLSVGIAFAESAPSTVAGLPVGSVLETLFVFVAGEVLPPLKPWSDPGKLPE